MRLVRALLGSMLLAAAGASGRVGDPPPVQLSDPLEKRRAAEMERRAAAGVAVTPGGVPEAKEPAPATWHVAAPQRAKPAAPAARAAELLPADLTPLLVEAFRFNKGVRFTGLLGGGVTVLREQVHFDSARARAAFDALVELLENEDPAAAGAADGDEAAPTLATYRERMAIEPVLVIELLASRPFVIECDFRRRRAIVQFNGRWSARVLPDDARERLLPAIGSELYAFLEAEAERGQRP